MTFGHCEVPRILWKGRRKKKKTLVLTLGSSPEKGGKKKKKTLVLTLGSPPEKGGVKKTHGINPGQTAGPRFQDLLLSVRRGLETKIGT